MNRPEAAVEQQVVVVGAGPAGLAAASALKDKGVDALVVEKGPSVATSWRSRHDHLRLNTHRVFSHQPGQRLPRALGPYPSRDHIIVSGQACWPTAVRTVARMSSRGPDGLWLPAQR